MGTAFHAAVEQWELSERTLPDADVLDVCTTAYDQDIAKMVERYPAVDEWLCGPRTTPDKDIKTRRARAVDQVKGYMQFARPQAFWIHRLPDDSPAVEVPFTLELSAGTTVRGFIDQVIEWPDGTIMVRDLKTGTKLPDDPLQLATYALAFQDLFGIPVRLGDYYMAKNNAPTVPYDLSNYTLELLDSMYGDLDRSIMADVFLPHRGDYCRVCDVSKWCSVIGSEPMAYPRNSG